MLLQRKSEALAREVHEGEDVVEAKQERNKVPRRNEGEKIISGFVPKVSNNFRLLSYDPNSALCKDMVAKYLKAPKRKHLL